MKNRILLPYFLSVIVFLGVLSDIADARSSKKSETKKAAESSAKADTGTVVKILDGDTYDLADGRRVRLLGLDTPEKGEPYSQDARQLAESMLIGKRVALEYDKNRKDKYDRYLVYLRCDGVFINKLLLERGLARLYLFKGTKRFNSELLAAQKRARNDKIGIWSLPAPEKEPFYISSSGSYRFHRPLCAGIKDINPKKAKRYKTREAALDDGLSPCRECRP